MHPSVKDMPCSDHAKANAAVVSGFNTQLLLHLDLTAALFFRCVLLCKHFLILMLCTFVKTHICPHTVSINVFSTLLNSTIPMNRITRVTIQLIP